MGLFSWLRRKIIGEPARPSAPPHLPIEVLRQFQQMVEALQGADWYYERNQQTIGPFSLAQLQQLLAVGHLQGDDLVWRVGTERVPIAQVLPASFPPLPASAPPPPPSAAEPGVIAVPSTSVKLPAGWNGPQWYYALDNKNRRGPFSFDQIRWMAQTGALAPQVLVWRAGMPRWIPLATVQGIQLMPVPARAPGGIPSVPPAAAVPPVTPPPLPTQPAAAAPLRPPSPAPPPRPNAPVPPGTLQLDAADFLPIAQSELKQKAQEMGKWNLWFGRRDLIPPADDTRTKLIDRALVSNGLLSPEQLIEIHQVGAEMERVRPMLVQAEQQIYRAGEDAVRAESERKARLKEQKKAESEHRKAERADAISRRRATDIIYLGRGVSRWLGDRGSNAEKLQSLGLPVLSTPAELANALGLSIPRLRWLAFHTDVASRVHYVNFTVKKKSGGLRTLSAPHRTLKAAQGWILDNVVNHLATEPSAHGFAAGKSILTNARAHAGQAVVVNVDLQDFFPTIGFPRVRSVFQRAGYSGAVATIMALLCTECPRRSVDYDGKSYHVATGQRGLPQGACTSPGLSNQVARRLDRRLTGLAARLGLTYTRYADDLTWSGPLPFPMREPADTEKKTGIGYLMARIRHIVEAEGFRVNVKKTRVLRQSAAQLVTGIVVNEKPSIRRKEIRRLRAILHHARREGLEAQNRAKHPHFRAWLQGKIAYVAMVRPDVGARLKEELDKIL